MNLRALKIKFTFLREFPHNTSFDHILGHLATCTYVINIFLGADYADDGSAEGKTRKEKGTYLESRKN